MPVSIIFDTVYQVDRTWYLILCFVGNATQVFVVCVFVSEVGGAAEPLAKRKRDYNNSCAAVIRVSNTSM